MKISLKTVILYCFINIIITSPSIAQNFRFGISGGPNFSTFHGNLNEFRKFRIGLHAGGTVILDLSDKWDINVEMIYSQQGIRWEDGQAQYKIYNDYLDFPFLIAYSINDRLQALLGPGVGVLLKSREITRYPGYEDIQNVTDQYNTIDIGIYLGIRYHITRHISAGLRYYNGFMWVELGANRRINAHFQVPVMFLF